MGRKLDKLVPLRVRAAALMPAAVLSVHQLRFELAFGPHAGSKLASEGHQYLLTFVPLAAMLLAIGVGLFLATLARAWQRGLDEDESRRPVSPFLKVWLLAAVSLLAIYCGQEFLEGLFVSAHPSGLAGVFGEGGLWAIPLAALLGAVVALGLRAAEVAVRWAAERRAPRPSRRAPSRPSLRPAYFFSTTRGPLADRAAGRAPPAAVPLTS